MISKFKEVTGTIIKEEKEGMMTILYQTDNINKQIDIKKNQMEIWNLKIQ